MLKKKNDILLIVFGAIMLCSVAFLNRFPLVYPDTGTYIRSGFTPNNIPIDRPIFYGLFIRHVSLWTTLWLVVFLQSLLVSYLLFKTLDLFYSGGKKKFMFCLSIIILTVFTGIGYNTGVLIADIFTPIGMLCMVQILLNNKLE